VAEVCALGEDFRNLERKWWKSKHTKQEITRLRENQGRGNEWTEACEALLMHEDYMSNDVVLFMEEDE